MRIFYLITQAELGGAQKYCLDLAKNFKNKHEVFFALGGKKDDYLFQELIQTNIPFIFLKKLKRSISLFFDLLVVFKIIRIIKKAKPDIIHLNSSKISILGSLAFFLANLFQETKRPRLIYTVHGWVFKEPMSKYKRFFYQWLEKFTARFKDFIICINTEDLKSAQEILKIPDSKLKLIYNSISEPENWFYFCDQARQVLSEKINLQLKTGEIILGALGNLYPTKGYTYLIEALYLLVEAGQIQKDLSLIKIKLLIIGEGEERGNLEKMIKERNLENNVFLVGSIKDGSRFLKAFDIFVLSSVKEGMPYCALEAMSAGLPIVASRVGGLPEMINEILIEPQKPEQLAQAILVLLKDNEKRKLLGQNNRKVVLEKFGFKEMMEKMDLIYGE